MRKVGLIALTATALAVPNVSAFAATKATKTTPKKKTVTRRITKVSVPVYPDHTDRSVYISQQALPLLVQETLQAQSTQIDTIGGATYTSQGFDQSLLSAIVKAKKG